MPDPHDYILAALAAKPGLTAHQIASAPDCPLSIGYVYVCVWNAARDGLIEPVPAFEETWQLTNKGRRMADMRGWSSE